MIQVNKLSLQTFSRKLFSVHAIVERRLESGAVISVEYLEIA